jgi:uncharacterized protein with GYD domain
MKKLTLKKPIFFFLLALSLLSIPGVAAGLEVQTTFSIQGEDLIIDKELEVNTEVRLAGIKYTDYLRTQSLGKHDTSKVNYTMEFNLLSGDEKNSTLNVDSSFEATNICQMASVRDYGLKSKQSFWTEGDTEAVVMFAVDNHSSSFDLAQAITGAGGYRLLVRNSTDWHTKEYYDTADYSGTLELLIGSFFGKSYYPAAGIGDFLQCPWGSTFGDCQRDEP